MKKYYNAIITKDNTYYGLLNIGPGMPAPSQSKDNKTISWEMIPEKLIETNINDAIFKINNGLKYSKHLVTKIQIRMKGNNGNYNITTYDRYLETKKNRRVEIVWKKGYECLMGRMGCATNGKINRLYIGKSTGILPVYLHIINRSSSGGSELLTEGIEHIQSIGNAR